MGWTVNNPVDIGADTMKSHWDKLWDNLQFVFIPFATIMLFGQSSAPTGWTKKTDWTDNSMLVYTTGSVGSGGSDNPTGTWTTTISINSESAHTHPMPHTHTLNLVSNAIWPGGLYSLTTGNPSGDTGAGSTHGHTVTQQDSFSPRYQKMIAAVKDTGSWISTNPVSAVGNAMKQSAHWEVLWANMSEIYLLATTVMLFGQSSAPTGWTKKTDWVNNSMLVYTTGSIGSSGSDNPISWTTAITITAESAHTHSLSHNHGFPATPAAWGQVIPGDTKLSNSTVANTGAGSSHTHTINQDTFAPLYQKIIAAVKDSGDWETVDPVALHDPTKKKQYDIAWDNIKFNYIPATTIMLFGQSSAPTGWTKKTDWTDNSMLVYTTGSVGSGGSDNPISSWVTNISLNNESAHTHSLGNHIHNLENVAELCQSGPPNWSPDGPTSGPSTNVSAGGNAHTHTVNNDTFGPYKYQKVIAATKDA